MTGSVLDDMDEPYGLRMLTFTRENRTKEVAEHMAALLNGVQDPEELASLRGTFVIAFPDEEFPDESPLLDPGVQALLGQLLDAVPHLLFFLSDLPGTSSTHFIIAAVSPGDLLASGDGGHQIRISEAGLYGFVRALVQAAQFAEIHGYSREVVMGHLASMPEAIRDQLKSVVLGT